MMVALNKKTIRLIQLFQKSIKAARQKSTKKITIVIINMTTSYFSDALKNCLLPTQTIELKIVQKVILTAFESRKGFWYITITIKYC